MTFWARLTWSRALFALLLLNLLWTASLFVAPFTIPPETVAGTVGGANMMDHADLWATLPPYAAVVYAFGDIQCHQLWHRSIYLNGNQMPIDARMTSMYVFANLGLVAAALATPASTSSQALLNGLPPWMRRPLARLRPEVAAGLVVVVGLLPIAVDGFTQLFGWRESTNELRVITGAPGGFVGGLLVGAMLMAIRQLSVDIQALRQRMAPPAPRAR